MRRVSGSVVVGAAILFALSCAGARNPNLDLQTTGPVAAVYRVRFDPGEGEKKRRFRLLVHAAEPDRLHGEVVSAVGTTELILDAGGERVSVHFVRDRVAFVGEGSAEALEALLGVRLSVGSMVDILLNRGYEGTEVQASVVYPPQGYPESVELSVDGLLLTLELKRLRPMRTDLSALGTGRPPDGVEIRPLQALDPETLPGVETEGAE